MTVEQRVRQLLQAACRVEREGNVHMAEGLRKMAAESLPARVMGTVPSLEVSEN